VRGSAPQRALEDGLKTLPKGLRWRLHRDEAADAWLVDVAADAAGAAHPFTQSPDGLEPVGPSPELRPLHAALETAGLAFLVLHGLPALCRMLSGALGTDVLSLASDDEELDMVWLAREGRLIDAETDWGDARFRWREGRGVEVELLKVPEDPEAEATNAEAFEGMPGIVVLPRIEEARPLLHGLAARRARQFLGGRETLLDLGSFDCLARLPPPVAPRPWWGAFTR
jgi:hypothetical protein